MATRTLSETLPRGKKLGLVSCLSFEERSLRAASEMAQLGLSRWICLLNEDIETSVDVIRSRASQIAKDSGARFSIHEISKRQPLRLADTLVTIFESVIRETDINWVVDVSTMTHEMLLVALAALDERSPDDLQITVLYNVAGQYSDNEAENRRKWVSRGIQGVRSVIGFAGLPVPGERSTLVALPGFDLERVARIVDELEPDRLLVGIGTPNYPEHTWMYERNLAVARSLLSTRSGKIFEYQSLDAEGAALAIFDAVCDEETNVVFTPLNSKVSTFAVGLLCRAVPQWQICYAPALVYNTRYSTPSDRFIVFNYNTLRNLIRGVIHSSQLEVEPEAAFA